MDPRQAPPAPWRRDHVRPGAGESDLDHLGRDRIGIGHDRHEAGCDWPDRSRDRVTPRRASPTKYLLRGELPTANHLGHAGARNKRLGDNPRLLISRPATTMGRTRQHLDPAKCTLRVIIKVKHSDSTKPVA